MRASRLPAFVVLVAVLAAIAATMALTVPWHPLPGVTGALEPSPRPDFTGSQIANAAAFSRAYDPSSYASMAASLLVILVLALTPLGARLVRWVARPFGGGWGWQVILGVVGLRLATRLAGLPFDAWGESVLRRYDLSTQSWPGWGTDVAKSFGINTGITVIVALVLYLLIRKLPRGWWLPAAVGGFALVVVLSFVYPVVVEPVFANFRPMRQGQLRSQLLHLAAEDDVPVSQVLVADASARTTSLNAYVSGFGATRRIVIYDTLLHDATPAEVRLVVAHELGHAAEHDVLYGTILGALGVSAGGCVLYLLSSWGLLLRRAGTRSARDPGTLALLLAIVAVFSVVSVPVQNLVSRHIEARADVHALDLTHDPEAFIHMQRALAVHNLSDLRPETVKYTMFSTHPTAPERIALARAWARLHRHAVPPPLAPSR
ncbi:MAG: M48 family metallopeptidase [Streptosporangiaceae bacterium]